MRIGVSVVQKKLFNPSKSMGDSKAEKLKSRSLRCKDKGEASSKKKLYESPSTAVSSEKDPEFL
jgi:hypothetical protein